MAKDYAQRTPSRRQTRGKASGGLPGWIWMIAGLSAGLAVAAVVYVSRPTGGGIRDGVAIEAPVAARVSAAERKRHDPPIPLPPKEKDRFTFYEILPNQEVIVPRDVAKAKAPPAAAGAPAAGATADAAGGGTYLIQVASYKARTEADRQKASLALLGVESKVESVTIDGKETYYRVRIGPEHDWNRVQLLMSRLEDNGISSLLVKVK